MSLFDNFIKRVAIDSERFKDLIKDLSEKKSEKDNVTGDDQLIAELRLHINRKLNDLSDTLTRFLKDLNNPDVINYYKNQEEIDKASKESKDETKKITKSVDVTSDQTDLPGIRKYFPSWQSETIKDSNDMSNLMSLDSIIKNEFKLMHDKIKSVMEDVKEVYSFKKKDDEGELYITYSTDNFEQFNEVLESLKTIDSDIVKLNSLVDKGVTAIDDSDVLLDKILSSEKLNDFFNKFIKLKDFARTQLLNKNFNVTEKNVVFEKNEDSNIKLSPHKKFTLEKEYNNLTDKLVDNNMPYVLPPIQQRLNEISNNLDNLSDNDLKDLEEIQKKLDIPEDSISLDKAGLELAQQKLDEILNNSEILSESELESIQQRLSELKGELPHIQQSEYESEKDSLIILLNKVSEFFKKYYPYIKGDSGSLFTNSSINSEFEKLYETLDYYYNVYKDTEYFRNDIDITDGTVKHLLVNELGLVPEKKTVNPESFDAGETNFVKILTNFITDTLEKISQLKSDIKDIFKRDKGSSQEINDSQFFYRTYVSYLKGIVTRKRLDVNVLRDLFDGVVDTRIADYFIRTLNSTKTELLENSGNVDKDKGVKLGLLFLLFNSVRMIYLNLNSIKTGKNTRALNSLFTRYTSDEISRRDLRELHNILHLIYSNIKKAADPVLEAKSDFVEFFKGIDIPVLDSIANFQDTFDIQKINEVVDAVTAISNEANEVLATLKDIKGDYLKPLNKDLGIGEIQYNSDSFPLQEIVVALSNIVDKTKKEDSKFDRYTDILEKSIGAFKKI